MQPHLDRMLYSGGWRCRPDAPRVPPAASDLEAIAPAMVARGCSVVCADLVGYGGVG